MYMSSYITKLELGKSCLYPLAAVRFCGVWCLLVTFLLPFFLIGPTLIYCK